MKTFLKSVHFKSILVLLIIAVISGGLLSILNTVLYVSPKERTDRAIKKLYGELKEYTVIIDVDGEDETKKNPIIYDEFGKIDKIYQVVNNDSYDLLFHTTGKGGYKGGTITLWVKVNVTFTQEKIEKVVMESYEKQTLMSKLNDSYYNTFLVDVTDKYFSTQKSEDTIYNPVSGATYSATAGNNGVNCVIKFLREEAI